MTSVDLSGASWFKSTHSGSQSACVEVAWLNEGYVGVRDSKNKAAAALIFAPEVWDAFTKDIRSGGLASA
ncbi:DUF397 domain-containing protein [Nocardia paucivorans]|uniref:DUF397 domain-containing protein n=1 Tax=Nocardia paucivorans TaxID=114259 RepID=UPI000A001B49|nr:DUF397 domain-containing protein [Nocardia paucivorans]